LLRVAIQLAAETRSFERAVATMKSTLGSCLSAKTVERLVGQVGAELASRHAQAGQENAPEVVVPVVPEVAVVSCDGGRIRTRTAGQGQASGLPSSIRLKRCDTSNGWLDNRRLYAKSVDELPTEKLVRYCQAIRLPAF
jgi:hypothetical protein